MICTEQEQDTERYHPARRLAIDRSLLVRVWVWLLVPILLVAILVQPVPLRADPVPVRYPEGSTHGFLALRSLEGKLLASGDLTQVIRGNEVVSHLVFSFKDGSLDDDTTVFSQRGAFRLISDHHIQRGPIFPHPINVSIQATTGQVTVRYKEKDREKIEVDHLDLPADLANGVIFDILKNILPDAKETRLSYVGADPKPRLVHLSITPQGEDIFSVAGARHKAIRFTMKVQLGGMVGMVAPLIGKQPADTNVWMVGGIAPAFVKAEGPLYMGGPIWSIEMTGPVWDRPSHSER